MSIFKNKKENTINSKNKIITGDNIVEYICLNDIIIFKNNEKYLCSVYKNSYNIFNGNKNIKDKNIKEKEIDIKNINNGVITLFNFIYYLIGIYISTSSSNDLFLKQNINLDRIINNEIFNNNHIDLINFVSNKLNLLYINTVIDSIIEDNVIKENKHNFNKDSNYNYYHLNIISFINQYKANFENNNYLIKDKEGIPNYMIYLNPFLNEKIHFIKIGLLDYIKYKKGISWDDLMIYFATIWDSLNLYFSFMNLNNLIYIPITIDEKIVEESLKKSSFQSKIKIDKETVKNIKEIFYNNNPSVNINDIISIIYPLYEIYDKLNEKGISFNLYVQFLNTVINSLFLDAKVKMFPHYTDEIFNLFAEKSSSIKGRG